MKFVGVDFGHGEVSASYYDGEQLCRLRLVLTSSENEDKYKMPSYLYKCRKEDNTFYYALEEHAPCSLISGMKKPVDRMNEEEKKHYQIFVQLIYQRLLECNQELLTDGDFELSIACPTKWSKEQKALYKSFFEEALSRPIYAIMNESDAAYFAKCAIGEGLTDALVVDYGSSTIDFTLVRNSRKVKADQNGITIDDWSSANLGASFIERAILNKYKADQSIQPTYSEVKDAILPILIQTNREWIDFDGFIKANIRKFKEDLFTYRKEYFDTPIFYRPQSHAGREELRPYKFEYQVNEKILEIPQIKEYIEAVKTHFKKVHQAIGGVEKIILSGGAACMAWVGETLLEEFGAQTTIIRDEKPSFVVCDGIVKYCYERQKCLEKFIMKVDEIDVPDIIKRTDEDVINSMRFSLLLDVFYHYASENNNKTTIDDLLDKIIDKTFRVFNTSNNDYAYKINMHIRERLVEMIKSHLYKVIYDVFGVRAEHVENTIAQFPSEELIRPYYNEETLSNVREYIKKEIIDNLSLPFILFSITYEKQREKWQREIISAELKKEESMKKFDEIEKLTTFEDLGDDLVDKIKNIIHTFAIELFDEEELFETCFATP